MSTGRLDKWARRAYQRTLFLTPRERLFLCTVIAILLVGLISRYFYLKSMRADAYDAPQTTQTATP